MNKWFYPGMGGLDIREGREIHFFIKFLAYQINKKKLPLMSSFLILLLSDINQKY